MKIIVEDVEKIVLAQMVAIDTETVSIKDKTLVGVSVYNGTDAYYLSPQKIRIDKLIVFCKLLLESSHYKKIFHNAKFDIQVFQRYGVEVNNFEDTMIMAWLAGCGKYKSIGLKQLTEEIFGIKAATLKSIGMKTDTNDIALGILADYAMDDVINTYKLYLHLLPKLDAVLHAEYIGIELPIIKILVAMENSGVVINMPKLYQIKETILKEIIVLEKKLLTSMAVNYTPSKNAKLSLNSPKQIKDFLETRRVFVESTDIKELSKSKDTWVIQLLEYRKKYKMYSTYIENLLPDIERNNGILKGNFNQAGTETGRFSSSNPNLQNLPAHDEIHYRSIFIPHAGNMFVVADYSQIELRVLAHLSQDKKMIEYFKNGYDLHSATAHGMFKLPCKITEVKEKYPEVRFHAKAINFGLLYGMGAKSLAAQINTSEPQAVKMIEKYFEQFPSVKNYIRYVQDKAITNGYISTIFGRKRFFPELREGSIDDKRNAYFTVLRKSINTKIQGSAADIVKLAMIKLFNSQFNILLQVHDELVVEVDKNNTRAAEIKLIMESAYPLCIPLTVNVKEAYNWNDGK